MKMYTVAEVAEQLKCSPSLVYGLIESKKLKCHRIGRGKQGGLRVSVTQLQLFLMEAESAPPPPAPRPTPALKLKHLKV